MKIDIVNFENSLSELLWSVLETNGQPDSAGEVPTKTPPDEGMTILRAKGSILSHGNKAFKLQCVGHLYELNELPSSQNITKTQLVFIGESVKLMQLMLIAFGMEAFSAIFIAFYFCAAFRKFLVIDCRHLLNNQQTGFSE